MDKLTTAKRVALVAALVEGMSISAVVRMTGVSKPTILKLLADLGKACEAYQDAHLTGLTSQRVQCDEIWSFGYARKNVPAEKPGEFGNGDVWTFTAIDADSKLVLSYFVGKRDAQSATYFTRDVALRLKNRVQLTTDGLQAYLEAVDDAFAGDINYGMIKKIYANDQGTENSRHALPVRIACEQHTITGSPDSGHIPTSYIERNDLTLRMQNKGFARLTNAHSKKLENHCHALALHFMSYNFACKNEALKGKTPAIAAGVADRAWTVDGIFSLLG
jgi:IS1 family transposase